VLLDTVGSFVRLNLQRHEVYLGHDKVMDARNSQYLNLLQLVNAAEQCDMLQHTPPVLKPKDWHLIYQVSQQSHMANSVMANSASKSLSKMSKALNFWKSERPEVSSPSWYLPLCMKALNGAGWTPRLVHWQDTSWNVQCCWNSMVS